MAIVKFINGRNEKVAGLIKAIDYVADENKTETFILNGLEHNEIEGFNQEDKEAIFIEKLIMEDKVNRAINYITKNEKTSINLIAGVNCNPNTAFDEMMITKKMYNKEKGRQFVHFVHSFHKDENITPELAHEISMEFIKNKKFNGFQVLAATHTNEEHLHTHFILNTVNIDTGRKWQLSTREAKELIKYSNAICEKYNLKYSFPNIEGDSYNKYKLENKSIAEYKAKKENRSWKNELLLTINECRKISKSREEFIRNMEYLDYKVRWEDTRKYITFTTPDGKLCRNNKLENPEEYTKESLEKVFSINKQIYSLSKEGTNEIPDDIQKQNKRSWKYSLYIDIKDSLKGSTSKEEFIGDMNNKGYAVRWEESRKDITFTFSKDGKVRKCNNDKLHPPEMFTKEALEKRFKANRNRSNIENNKIGDKSKPQIHKEKHIQATKDIIVATAKMLEDNPQAGNKNYPLSYLEGEALKEKMIEKAKGEGLDWEKEK